MDEVAYLYEKTPFKNRSNGRNGQFIRINPPLRIVRMDEIAFLYEKPPHYEWYEWTKWTFYTIDLPLRIVRMDRDGDSQIE